MEFQYFGGNCIKLTTKKATFVFDDTVAAIGGKAVAKEGDILLYTDVTSEPAKKHFSINSPGEYEVAEVTVYGVAARRHIDEVGINRSVMYKIDNDDLRVAIIGNIYPDLNEEQLEGLGMVDVLILPVGGNGLTVDPVGALQLIKKIEPKIIIPTHYADDGLQYPVPQRSLAEALKELAMEPARTEAKFKLKPTDIPEHMQLVVLEKQ